MTFDLDIWHSVISKYSVQLTHDLFATFVQQLTAITDIQYHVVSRRYM